MAGALDYLLTERFCIPDAIRASPVRRVPIPVGCELVDCCPGCPVPERLEWRIHLDARVATRAELRFDGLAAADLGQLQITGAAALRGDRILLRAGETRIAAIPGHAGNRVTTGLLQPQLSGQAARRVPRRSGAAAAFTDRISVQQFAGPFLVNSFSWDIVIKPCSRPTKPPVARRDRLKIEGVAPGDAVVVMLDGRTGEGCRDGSGGSEWVFSTAGDEILDNLLSPATCRSEIAVFSTKHAMNWQPLTWTDAPGDLRTVTLDPLIEAALNIWVPDDATKVLAEEHAQIAHDLFLSNRVGARLIWKVTKLSDVPGAPSNAKEIVEAGVSNDALDCLDLAAIRAQPFYVPNTLNVYYVDKAFTGRNCAIKSVPLSCITSSTPPDFTPADANINFIGSVANATTLVHELGHAYGLRPLGCGGHTNSVAGISQDNIMWGGGGSIVPRTTLTLGQVFRMNTHADDWGGTMLIPNNALPRIPRQCFPHQSSAACPRLDVTWP